MLEFPISLSLLLSVLWKDLSNDDKIRNVLLGSPHIICDKLRDIESCKVIAKHCVIIVDDFS